MLGPYNVRSATELKGRHNSLTSRSPRDRRRDVSICVIDDSPFDPQKNLENNGYRITFLGDVNSIEVVHAHEIVLCDLQGVGHGLDSKKQGAFIIREIKKTFPEKFVIAYSGFGLNQTLTREALSISDEFLKKDADIETWVEKLDAIIAQLLDPLAVWQRQRRALVEKDIDTLTILRLEDAFVRSIGSRVNTTDNTPLGRLVHSGRISTDVRSVVQSLVASAIFRILVG